MGLLKKVYHFTKRIGLAFRKPRYNSKVFCIGYNKTGTTTIGKSLELLGYRNTSFNQNIFEAYKNNEIEKVLQYTAKFDSADDLPWLSEKMIPLLDKTFPHSKFIYLERDEESWKKSLKKWRKKVFGDEPDLELQFAAFKAHEKFVKDYFTNREGIDLIVLDIKDEEGMLKLAKFLGKKTEAKKFPHFNKTST